MDILFLETLGYESALRISGHHYARLLAGQGHRVFSLSAPVSPFHRFARRSTESIQRRLEHHATGFFEAPGGVRHYVPHTWIPVRNQWPLNLPLAIELSARCYGNEVLSRLQAESFWPDAVHLQNLVFAPLSRRFPKAVLHYRLTDRMSEFSNYPSALLKLEREICERADLISVTSRQLLEDLPPHIRPKTLYTPNGVDLEHFSAPRPRPDEFAQIDVPIAIYIGALREWFDWPLLLSVVRKMPGIHFVLISPDRPDEDFLRQTQCTWIPGVPYESLPAYYQHAAVTLIPFQDTPLISAVSPLKMFESLAAGTPVVAREWKELRDTGAPVELVADAASMALAAEAIVKEGMRPGPETRGFLGSCSWEANLERINERIEAAIASKSASNP